MRRMSIFQTIQDLFSNIATSVNGGAYSTEPMDEPGANRGAMWHHMNGRNQELFDVTEDVASEQQARLAMLCRSVGERSPNLSRLVLSYLRQEPVHDSGQSIAREGAWIQINLPDVGSENEYVSPRQPIENNGGAPNTVGFDPYTVDAPYRDQEPADEVLDRIDSRNADLLLYLVDAEHGWQDGDAQWYARLRSLGKPLLPVFISIVETDTGEPAQFDPIQAEKLRSKLAIQPAQLCIREPPRLADTLPDQPPDDVIELIRRILAVAPRVAIPLAQDIAWSRHTIATRVIRTGALITGLVGAEPIPLLDLPLHVALHWKVALQLAAIHGRPGLDIRSREMVGTITLNLCIRYLAQQILKLIPVIGWALSGALSGLSTFLLGHALLRYYENDQLWNWMETKDAWQKQRSRIVRSMADHGKTFVSRTGDSTRAVTKAWRRPVASNEQDIPVLADADDG